MKSFQFYSTDELKPVAASQQSLPLVGVCSELTLEKSIAAGHSRGVELSDLIKSPKSYVTRALRGGALKAYLKPLNERGFSQLQKDAIIGGALGDGRFQYCGAKIPWYKFDQKASKKDYVDLLYSIFHEYVGMHPKPRYKDGLIHSYWFRTYRLQGLDFYTKQFYALNSLGKRVIIVPKLIHRWLNPQSLAFWFMDDGSKNPSSYTLCTQSFSYSDCVILQQALGRVFNLEVSIHKANRDTGTFYALYVVKSSSAKFRQIVEPHMIECMKYKLHEE
jgi:hypothetical protein